ncbi:Dehydrogenase [Candidatus Rhodobacter oscarellae]|uniref:Dehydrogenase n=1 Tax=Candidatus Rhodobacter oscarellae TaxID=1675527 RepID=A0A0J9E337_9RHOB|nr:SDR family oxidoreductase [Candidatus Rhodobacter lobularis]KMW57107.1 Dehydrogenase [Candidatus Rhodobacter lobularis]
MARTVLITGCSSGFGKLAAKSFLAQQWNVIATMRAPERESELISGDNLILARLDVTDPSSIRAAVEAGSDRFGGIDVLVNNAGYGGHALFEEATDASIHAMFETNVFGPMNTMRAVMPGMRKQGGGTIINVSSMAGLIPVPGNSVYTASKHALNGLSEAMALECAPFGIKVRIVEPGAFPTTQFLANVDTRSAGNDAQLKAYETKLRAHFAAQVAQSAAQSGAAADPQDVADKIFECATQETPVHNPVGADAGMLVGMMAAASSRQDFLDQVAPMLTPQDL